MGKRGGISDSDYYLPDIPLESYYYLAFPA